MGLLLFISSSTVILNNSFSPFKIVDGYDADPHSDGIMRVEISVYWYKKGYSFLSEFCYDRVVNGLFLLDMVSCPSYDRVMFRSLDHL